MPNDTPSALRPDETEPSLERLGFRSWAMVAVAAAAMVATLPGRTHGLGMITERLLADESLGLTRLGYGRLNLVATLIGALFCLGFGRLIDRFGVRSVMTATILALGASVVGMSGAGGWAALFVLLTLTRGFGQSALSVASITMVGKCFPRRVSWAMALFTVLLSIGFIVASVVSRPLAEAPWREFWSGMGLWVVALAPVAWLLMLLSPRTGKPTAGTEEEAAALPADQLGSTLGATLGEAARTPAFWLFLLATSLFGLITSGLSLFGESILVERGLPPEAYYDALGMGVGVGLLGNFLAGWLAARGAIATLTGAALLLLSGSLVWLTQVHDYAGLTGYVVTNALAGSVITVVFFTAWPQLYGRRHLGRIQGAAQMGTVVASALGPLLVAWGRDRFDAYEPVLLAIAGATALLGAAAFFTPRPGPGPAAVTQET